MGSNYQTVNENVLDEAKNLKNLQYSEIDTVQDKENCDYLVISHTDKTFFFTRKNNKSDFNNLLNTLN